MIKKLYDDILENRDRRNAFIALKQELKDDRKRDVFRKLTGGNYDGIMRCLVDEDAKNRKNAAVILGMVKCQDALDVLVDAYEEEDQLFVKADYIKAISELDCEPYLEFFHKRLQELLAYQPAEAEIKHIQSEIRQIQNLILLKEGVKKHTFSGFFRSNDIILLTAPAFLEVTAEQISAKHATLGTGIRTVTDDMESILKIRTFREMLFMLSQKKNNGRKAGMQSDKSDKSDDLKHLPAIPEVVATQILESDLLKILKENHKEDSPFYFRIGMTGSMPLEQRSVFVKKISELLESGSGRQLINTSSYYEIEIRLIQNRDGTYLPCLKLFTIPDSRFSYRKYSVSSGMQPYLAAGILALARPYLTEYAQVLDPFCGTGTLLIERNYMLTARSSYGIDIFGEAIQKARANSKIAGMPIHYINRNFDDFRHEYKFDEIITDMPAGMNMDKDDISRIYRMFFQKAAELLNEHGRIICYSGEMGILKKHLRLRQDFKLLKEIAINEKSGYYLYIIEHR